MSGMRMRKQFGAGGLRDEKRRHERRLGLPVKRDEAPPAPAPRQRLARVLFDFVGVEDGDLSLKEGQIVVLLNTKSEWWKGHLEEAAASTAGNFPHNYVEELTGLAGPWGSGPATQLEAQLQGELMAQACCSLIRTIVIVAVVLVVGAVVGSAWVFSGSSVAQLPLPVFRWRYSALKGVAKKAGKDVTTWDEPPTEMRSLFGHMYNSTPVVVRQGYPQDSAELRWLLDDAQIEAKLGGPKANLTVEARPKGSKQFTYGTVEYRSTTVEDFLAHRGGDGLAGLAAEEVQEQKELYLVQQPVNVAPPAWFDGGLMTIESTNVWMSGNSDGGEVSACHYDLSDNLIVVVEGQKTLTLIPPADTPLIYPVQPADGLGAFESAYSGIDDVSVASSTTPDGQDAMREHPRFAEARRFTVTLNPGDALLIPRLWWHQVAGIKGVPSTSVNFWFRNAYSYSDKQARDMIRLNYDLYLEKRAQTLRFTRFKRFQLELSRLVLGPEPVPAMNIVYSHNPDDLEGDKGDARAGGVQRFETPGSSGEVAVPQHAPDSCMKKGWIFTYEEMGVRELAGDAEATSEFNWGSAAKGGNVAVKTDGKNNKPKVGPEEEKLSNRQQQQLDEALNRADALFADLRFEAALIYYQRAVSVAPDRFLPRWKTASTLLELKRLDGAMRQLRCAVPSVPAENLQGFFSRYLLTLYTMDDVNQVVPDQVLLVAQRYVDIVPPWVSALQLTQGPYEPSAEDGTPSPFYDEWCAESGLCNTIVQEVHAIKEELDQILELAEQSDFGVQDTFPPADNVLATGGDLTLVHQAPGKMNLTACGLAPVTCEVVKQIPLLFQRLEDPLTQYGWSGVPATVAIRHVKPWTRERPQIRQNSNDVLTMIVPLSIRRNSSHPRPWIRLGKEKRLFYEGEPVLFDPSFIMSAYFPMKMDAFLLVLNFWKPPLCAMRRCALTAEELLPPALRDDYTDNGKIPVIDWALGRVQTSADEQEEAAQAAAGKYENDEPVVWSQAMVEAHVVAFTAAAVFHRSYNTHVDLWSERCIAEKMEPGGMWNTFQAEAAPSASVSLYGRLDEEVIPPEAYPGAALLHVLAFAKYDVLKGADVVVVGSVTPWIEAIVHNHGAKSITTVEHNVPECEDDRIKTMHYDDFSKPDGKEKFDVLVTYSSVEHAGLGRYGDPLDPAGDIKAMASIRASLKPGGTLFWGAPVGQDGLMWNAMRIYGRKRLPKILAGFEVLEWFGHEESVLDTAPAWQWTNQPVLVLRKTL